MSFKFYPFLLLLTVVACSSDPPPYPADPVDGQIFVIGDGEWHAYDAVGQQWLAPEAFWLAYAERRGGLSWGRGTEYPDYGKVEELDTFMVELESGICLMEFFHGSWRRANDVRRWGDAFNTYSGCPHVFD